MNEIETRIVRLERRLVAHRRLVFVLIAILALLVVWTHKRLMFRSGQLGLHADSGQAAFFTPDGVTFFKNHHVTYGGFNAGREDSPSVNVRSRNVQGSMSVGQDRYGDISIRAMSPGTPSEEEWSGHAELRVGPRPEAALWLDAQDMGFVVLGVSQACDDMEFGLTISAEDGGSIKLLAPRQGTPSIQITDPDGNLVYSIPAESE